MQIITAKEAFEWVNERKDKILLGKLPEWINNAIIKEETSIYVDFLSESVQALLEEKGYKISRARNKSGFRVSWDLSKPSISVDTTGTDFFGSYMMKSNLFFNSYNLKGSYPLSKTPDGVYILTSNKICVRPDAWFGYKYQTPVGIAVIEGNKKYVVALKSSPKELQFLPSRETATSNQFNELDQAKEDWNGKENTAQLVAAGSPAAKYCDEYSCGNIPAGSWYLPAFGEMIFMQNRKNIIDAALTLCGGEPLHYGWHWTSTAASPSSAWLLYWNDGGTYGNGKDLNYQVRPISAFL